MGKAIDIVRGRIIDYDERTQEFIIRAKYPNWITVVKRGYKECEIKLIDSRPLSDKQRKACYSLIREISRFTGQGLNSTKKEMKKQFMTEELGLSPDETFSLSDAPMSLVCEFQRYLVQFLLDWDIPCSFPLLDFVDDVGSYIYHCLVNKKCVICGAHSDLHHIEHVGAGRDREDIVHEGMEVLPLCRKHHNEVHAIGWYTFMGRYHIEHGIKLDKFLCKIYELKYLEDELNAEPDCFDGQIDT